MFKLLFVIFLGWLFLAFLQSLLHWFFCFFQLVKFSLESQSWYFFFSIELFIIVFLNSLVINGALFPYTIFSFRGACLFSFKCIWKAFVHIFLSIKFSLNHLLIKIVQKILFIKLFIISENNLFWWNFVFRHEIIIL